MDRIAPGERLEVLDVDGVGDEPGELWTEQAVVLGLIRDFG